ncbi:MAG: purine-binding chemotaxis protein CheW [Leptospiraceae bacterium]|nr:purine-binding chemotaxis protein CheW [Leptospiraceae bacterium]
MEETEVIQAEEVIQFLAFSVSGELFGIELIHVHEILRPVYITRIPNVEEFILGMINLRGEIIPIIDLKKKFDQGFTEIATNNRIVVLEYNTKRFGLLVEEVRQVIKIIKNSITAINDTSTASIYNNMIDFVGRSENNLVLIVELNKLLDYS